MARGTLLNRGLRAVTRIRADAAIPYGATEDLEVGDGVYVVPGLVISGGQRPVCRRRRRTIAHIECRDVAVAHVRALANALVEAALVVNHGNSLSEGSEATFVTALVGSFDSVKTAVPSKRRRLRSFFRW